MKTDLSGDLGMDERLITNTLLEKFGVELYLVQFVGCCESVCELCGSITNDPKNVPLLKKSLCRVFKKSFSLVSRSL